MLKFRCIRIAFLDVYALSVKYKNNIHIFIKRAICFFSPKGGEGTREEMCFSFLTFYPSIDFPFCGSIPGVDVYNGFLEKAVP